MSTEKAPSKITSTRLSEAGIDPERITRTPDDVHHVMDADGHSIATWTEVDGGWEYYDERTYGAIWFDGSEADLAVMLIRIAEAQAVSNGE